MPKQRFFRTAVLIALPMFGLFGTAPASADMYQVTVNTSSLAGGSGNLDFQFNPGPGTTPAATALVSNFSSDGSLIPPAALTGDASGSLPGTLTLDNGTAFNDYFQPFTFGTTITFDVTLSGGVDVSDTTGSSFAFSLYDAGGVTPLLTTDPSGSVLTVNLNTDGSTTLLRFPATPGELTTVGPLQAAVPEPSTLTLALLGLGGACARQRFPRRLESGRWTAWLPRSGKSR